MNARSCCLILAAGLMTTTLPGFAAQMQNNSCMSSQQNQSSQAPVRGRREAMKMVPARATFTKTLESQNAQPGTQIEAKLTRDAKLENGTKLPKGTVLVGQVTTDNTQTSSPRLAVRFTQARVEGGQTIPIKATIVGIYNTPDANGNATYWGGDPNTIPPSWNDGTLQVDQIDALPGIDLHSKVASRNSGVFVSNKKSDIKLSPEYSLVLAIAPSHGGMNGMNGMNGNGMNGDMNGGNMNNGMSGRSGGGMNGSSGAYGGSGSGTNGTSGSGMNGSSGTGMNGNTNGNTNGTQNNGH